MESWEGHWVWMAQADAASRYQLVGPLNPRRQGNWDRASYKSYLDIKGTAETCTKLAFHRIFSFFFFMACNLPWRATIGKVNKRPHCFLVNIYHHHAILSSWNTAPTFQTNGLNCDRSSRCVSIPMLGQRVPPRCPRIPSCQFHEVPQVGTTLPAPWYP